MVPPKRRHSQEQGPTSYGRYTVIQSRTELGVKEEHSNEPPSELIGHASATTSGRSRAQSTRGGGEGEGRGEVEGAEEGRELTDLYAQHAAGRRLLARYTSAQSRTSLRAESNAQALGDDLSSTENVRLSSGEPTAGGSRSQSRTTSQRSRGKNGSAPAVCVPPPPPHITASSTSPTAHAEESNLSTTSSPPDSHASLRGATGEGSHPQGSHSSANALEDTPASSHLSSEQPSSKRQDREARQRAQRSAIPSSTGTTVYSPSARSPSLPASMREGRTQGDQQRVPSTSRSVERSDLHRRMDVPTSRRYLLHILQQPSTGSAYGSRLLSRLAIAPPLVVQLQVIDAAGREVDIDDQMPLLICQISLRTRNDECADMLTANNPSGKTPDASTTQGTASTSGSKGKRAADKESSGSDPPGQADDPKSPSVRLLYGSLIASARRIQLVDPPRSAIVFIFPEVSIRSRGQFRLRIDLHRLNIPLPVASILASPRPKSAAPPPPPPSKSSASLSIIPQQPSSSLLSTPQSSSAQQASSSSTASSSSRSASFNGSLLATALSEVVTVVLPAQYVAPHVTDLTRYLASQGVALLLPPSSQNVE